MKMEKLDKMQRQKAKGRNRSERQMKNWEFHAKEERTTSPSRNRERKLTKVKRMKLEETNRPG